jgi:hypothetical protein
MRIYVANCTSQLQALNFRLIEDPRRGHSTQNIGMARQEIIAGDLTRPQIDYFIEQQRIYGLHAVEDLDRAFARKVYVPLVYSVDKPVSHAVWQEVIEKNKILMKEMGSKLRREAAIATSHGMRDFSPQAADTVSLSVEEEKTGTMDHGGDQPLAEGYRMTTEP